MEKTSAKVLLPDHQLRSQDLDCVCLSPQNTMAKVTLISVALI